MFRIEFPVNMVDSDSDSDGTTDVYTAEFFGQLRPSICLGRSQSNPKEIVKKISSAALMSQMLQNMWGLVEL
jgi:hypothetical protein